MLEGNKIQMEKEFARLYFMANSFFLSLIPLQVLPLSNSFKIHFEPLIYYLYEIQRNHPSSIPFWSFIQFRIFSEQSVVAPTSNRIESPAQVGSHAG